ncbi:tetratricopeptide repeat protein [Dokdonella sp.]|uniref:tetratricopeptide repeat protein n=1 Tax=Dokdonella sp. TaxID=2291710 RepID=UPI003C659560
MNYQFASFIYDTHRAQLSGPEGEIALRPITLSVLRHLLENPLRVISHEELLDRVWGRQAVSIGVLSQSIRELRQALGDSARNSAIIETKHKLGYCLLIEPVVIDNANEADAAPSAEAAQDSASMVDAPGSSSRPRSLQWGAALGGLVVVASLLAFWAWRSGYLGNDPLTSGSMRAQEILHDSRPQEPEARSWYALGLDALDAGNLVDARMHFEKVLNREPDSVAAMTSLADTLARSGKLAEARILAKQASELSGPLPRTSQLRVQAFAATLEYRRADAINALQALHQLDRGDADAGFRLAEALMGAGRVAEAGNVLEQMQADTSPRLDRSRLALMQARLVGMRGDHAARLVAAIEAVELAENDHARVDALFEQAVAHQYLGEVAAARSDLELVDALLEKTPWPGATLRREMIAATLLREDGRYAEAIAGFESVAKRAASLGQRSTELGARREAAFVMSSAGDSSQAIDSLKSLLGEQEALGDPRELASTMDVLSVASQHAGDQVAAQEMAQQALRAYLDADDQSGEASVRNNLGMMLARSGRAADAQEQWEKAAELFEQGGDRRGKATTLGNLAVLYARSGRVDAAREANESALEAFRELGATLDVSRLQFNLGVQDRRAGRLANAEQRFREAFDGFSAIGATDFRLQVAASLSELLILRAEPDAAQKLLDSIVMDDKVAPQRRAAIATARAHLFALRGSFESAEASFREARQLRAAAGLEDWVRMSDLDLAELSARQGNLAVAEQAARELRRALLAASDANAAVQAGVLLAGLLSAQERFEAAERLLDELEKELVAHPDALLTLRTELLRAAMRSDEREVALGRVAERAREAGFELLALRAAELGEGELGKSARLELDERGLPIGGMPSSIAY